MGKMGVEYIPGLYQMFGDLCNKHTPNASFIVEKNFTRVTRAQLRKLNLNVQELSPSRKQNNWQ